MPCMPAVIGGRARALVQLDQGERQRRLAAVAAKDLGGVEGHDRDAIVVVRDAVGRPTRRRRCAPAFSNARRRGARAADADGRRASGRRAAEDAAARRGWEMKRGGRQLPPAPRGHDESRSSIKGSRALPAAVQPPPSTSMNSGLVKASAVDAVLAEVAVGQLGERRVGSPSSGCWRSPGRAAARRRRCPSPSPPPRCPR